MFQVPEMAGDPITRTTALISLVCALMSLSYGCIFIVRFGTMRSMFRASRWAQVCHHMLLFYSSLTKNSTGSAKNRNVDNVERLGAHRRARSMASMVHGRIHCFHSFVRLENWSYE
jgi:hypothetical protein